MIAAKPFAPLLVLPCLLLGAVAGCLAAPATQPGDGYLLFRGMSDASAAVALDDHTIVVGDDETNGLRVYDVRKAGDPVAVQDIDTFLHLDLTAPEADIEGATKVGDRAYWIGSHGRNKAGRVRPSRQRFFATTVGIADGRVTVTPVGQPCECLLDVLATDPALRVLHLEQAIGPDVLTRKGKHEAIPELAPNEKGLNIEALAASADGKTLYLGLRNPRAADPKGGPDQALLLPLLNAAEVVERGARPRFGAPLRLDLGGLGFRDMAWSPRHRTFFILAGNHGHQRGGVLYRWSGDPAQPPAAVRKIPDLQPEAIIPFAGTDRLLVLSDDGTLPVHIRDASECQPGEYQPDGTCANKALLDLSKRTFRGVWVEP